MIPQIENATNEESSLGEKLIPRPHRSLGVKTALGQTKPRLHDRIVYAVQRGIAASLVAVVLLLSRLGGRRVYEL
jgi:hypothetical protein